MKSVMTHQFSRVPTVKTERSGFDRSHGYKTTFDAGLLIPIYVDEVLPGDSFNLKMNFFARLATPLRPVMDNMYLESFFFAVPVRLVWSHWKNFMGEKATPSDSTIYTVPVIHTDPVGYDPGTLYDYMGIPTNIAVSFDINALPMRCYNLIWNEWFRDQNLQTPVQVPTGDGADSENYYQVLRRGKRHDYFTSCLPWPQKGSDVSIPLGTYAPVESNNLDVMLTGATGDRYIDSNNTETFMRFNAAATASGHMKFASQTGLRTNLSTATAQTINALRQAFQLQRLYERDARGGTRYIEIIKSHFGVTSPDFRQQRPEYLGGGSSKINIHPIARTNKLYNGDTAEETGAIGELSGFGTVAGVNHGFTKSFTEHCYIIGLVCVRADLSYQQGLERMWSRSTRFDFYWPALSHLGEQAVLNKEIYLQGTSDDNLTFGYQERFAEYRYKPSKITGQFRSTADISLDVWHLSQEFGALPTLGENFIIENPPVDRVIAVPTEPHFIFDSYIDLKCVRPMPVYSVPGMIDHF